MRLRLLLALAIAIAPQPALAQAVGDSVRLESSNPAGVPAHPADSDPSYVRWPNGTEGRP